MWCTRERNELKKSLFINDTRVQNQFPSGPAKRLLYLKDLSMKVFLFGASVAAGVKDDQGGWAKRLHAQINQANIETKSDCKFFNLAVSGYSTEDIIKSFTDKVNAHHDGVEPCAVLFAIGTNDSQWLVHENRERFTPEEFRENLEKLLLLARQKTQKIGFVGLTPIQEDVISPKPWKKDRAYICKRVETFNNVLREFCRENKLFFVDNWKDWTSQDYSTWIHDGLHPNTEGHARIAANVRPLLAELGALPSKTKSVSSAPRIGLNK